MSPSRILIAKSSWLFFSSHLITLQNLTRTYCFIPKNHSILAIRGYSPDFYTASCLFFSSLIHWPPPPWSYELHCIYKNRMWMRTPFTLYCVYTDRHIEYEHVSCAYVWDKSENIYTTMLAGNEGILSEFCMNHFYRLSIFLQLCVKTEVNNKFTNYIYVLFHYTFMLIILKLLPQAQIFFLNPRPKSL